MSMTGGTAAAGPGEEAGADPRYFVEGIAARTPASCSRSRNSSMAGAMVFSGEWNLCSAAAYVQDVQGLRRDVKIIDTNLLYSTWYLDSLPILQAEVTDSDHVLPRRNAREDLYIFIVGDAGLNAACARLAAFHGEHHRTAGPHG